MNNQNIKNYQQKELNLMRINCKKQEIIFFPLPRDKRWEIRIHKNELISFTSEDKMKPNTTEFSFFYYNG